jgi:hypothetical protein
MKISTKTGWLNKYASGTSSVQITPAPQSITEMLLTPFNKAMALTEYNKKLAIYNNKNVDPDILMKQLYRESRFNPKAGSSKGAKGLAQITDNTLKYYKSMTKDTAVDPYNTNDAIKIQKWIMNDLYNSDFIHKKDQSPDVRLIKTLAAYNMGRTSLSNYLNKQKEKGKDIYNSTDWIKGLPVETRNYINDVFYNSNDVFNTEFNKAVSDSTYKPIIKEYSKSPVVINDDRGQWAHPGEVTRINSNNITMEQVPYPVLGIGADGEHRMMYPEEQHTFNQGPVTEYPMMQAKNGGWLTHYGKGGWLDDISSTLNPYNWRVTDYTKSGTRGQAFAAARKAGEKEFMWNGERFNTNYAGTPEQQLKETGIIDDVNKNKESLLDKRIKNNVYNGG